MCTDQQKAFHVVDSDLLTARHWLAGVNDSVGCKDSPGTCAKTNRRGVA